MNEQQTTPTPDETLIAPSPTDTELTSLRTENTELKHQLRLRNARDDLTKLLTAENARSPELLFDAVSPRLDFDNADTLRNASELLTDLKRRFPEQFVLETQPKDTGPSDTAQTRSADPVTRVPTINSGAGRAPNRSPLTKEALAKMSPRDITKLNWNDVRHVLEQ